MTNKEECHKRRNKLAQDQEKHAKAKALDAERKRAARAATTKSDGSSNEVRRLEKALQEALEAGDQREKAARQDALLFKVSHQDVSRAEVDPTLA